MTHKILPLNANDFDRLPPDLVGFPVYFRVDEKSPENGILRVWPKPTSDVEFLARYEGPYGRPSAVNTAGRFAADVVPMKE